MRHKLAVIIAVATLGTSAAVGTALASSHFTHAVAFSATLTPHKDVHVGRTLTLTSSHAKKNLQYGCALTVANLKTHVSGSDENFADIDLAKSSSTGHLKCKLTFKKFKVTDSKGHTRHCPLWKRDVKAGFVCGVGAGDVNTRGDTSHTFVKFTAHGSWHA
jgi:hypothetical protein